MPPTPQGPSLSNIDCKVYPRKRSLAYLQQGQAWIQGQNYSYTGYDRQTDRQIHIHIWNLSWLYHLSWYLELCVILSQKTKSSSWEMRRLVWHKWRIGEKRSFTSRSNDFWAQEMHDVTHKIKLKIEQDIKEGVCYFQKKHFFEFFCLRNSGVTWQEYIGKKNTNKKNSNNTDMTIKNKSALSGPIFFCHCFTSCLLKSALSQLLWNESATWSWVELNYPRRNNQSEIEEVTDEVSIILVQLQGGMERTWKLHRGGTLCTYIHRIFKKLNSELPLVWGFLDLMW